MSDPVSWFYIATAAVAAGGTYVDTQNRIRESRERQQILEAEMRSNDLAALDEENQRLFALREANEDMLARSGGVEAWASPSLLAARAFNFKMASQDIETLRYNQAATRANISARIAMLKRNRNATRKIGILQMAEIGLTAGSNVSALKKPSTTVTKTKTKKMPKAR